MTELHFDAFGILIGLVFAGFVYLAVTRNKQ